MTNAATLSPALNQRGATPAPERGIVPSTLQTKNSSTRQRRVRRMAGLLAGGAVVATAAIALPALAQTHDTGEIAGAGPTTPTLATSIVPSTTTELPATTTTAAPEAAPVVATPSPEEQLRARLDAMTPAEKLAFTLYTASPAERAAFAAFISPPPPAPVAAPKPAAAPAPTAPAATPAPASGGGTPPNSFLACVRNRESRGNYQARNASGAAGAYQMMPGTWNNVARHAGRPDLVGKSAASASPADQDAMAASLYAWQGRAPWAGPGC
jgi:soluble lytic murein transglycosylase-like protein